MRIIKFRAWNKDTKTMIDLRKMTVFATDIKGLFLPDNDELLDLELMQFTGLLDKNGKEIYEGDILEEYDEIVDITNQWTVEWAEGFWKGFQLYKNGTVIGNIHENMELIK